jgi:hypothetical protein
MLAHELRNPLHAVSTALKLQERVGAQDESNVELRDAVTRQIKPPLARLVDDLLDVSRITRGKIALQVVPRPTLREQLRHALDIGRAQAAERGTRRIQLSMPEGAGPGAGGHGARRAGDDQHPDERGEVLPAGQHDPQCRWCAPHRGRSRGPRARHGRGRRATAFRPRASSTDIFDLFVQVEQSLARSRGGLGIGLDGGPLAGRAARRSGARGEPDRGRPGQPIHDRATRSTRTRCSEHRRGRSGGRTARVESPPLSIVHRRRQRGRGSRARAAPARSSGTRIRGGPRPAAQGRELILRSDPDVALVDVGLPGTERLRAGRGRPRRRSGSRTEAGGGDRIRAAAGPRPGVRGGFRRLPDQAGRRQHSWRTVLAPGASPERSVDVA